MPLDIYVRIYNTRRAGKTTSHTFYFVDDGGMVLSNWPRGYKTFFHAQLN